MYEQRKVSPYWEAAKPRIDCIELSNQPKCVEKTKDGKIVRQEEKRLEEGAVKPESRAWPKIPRSKTIFEQASSPSNHDYPRNCSRRTYRTSGRELLRRIRGPGLARVLARTTKRTTAHQNSSYQCQKKNIELDTCLL